MAQQPNRVEVWLFKGKETFIKKVEGKVYGGIVSFKEADPSKPPVWLGQRNYAILNLTNKKSVLFYDTMTGTLFKPKDMSNIEDNIDMVMQTSQNVLLAGKESKNALGIEESKSSVFNFALAIIIVMAIIFLVFLYLFYTHIPEPAGATSTLPPTSVGGLVPGGPNLVPTTAVTET